MNYTFTPQSEMPALFMSKKSPHSVARIVLCLLWNAIAVHLILNDSEVSPRHPSHAHTHTHPSSERPPSLTGPLPSHVVMFRSDKSQTYSGCNQSLSYHLPLGSVYIS